MRVYAGPPVLQVSVEHPQYGTWNEVETTRARTGIYPGSNVVTQSLLGGGVMDAYQRLLSEEELWAVYKMVPDVRSSIDSIVRLISTWDWQVTPVENMAKDDALYDAALDASEEVRRFLAAPNQDGEVWQTWCGKATRDLLVYDAWATENVLDGQGMMEEAVVLPGGTVMPRQDRHQRVIDYKQVVSDGEVYLDPEQVVYFNLFPSTHRAGGTPLIETLINEIITLMRASKHVMLSYDADEVPPGVLLLAGIAGKASERAVASIRNMRGADHKLRVLTTNNPKGMDAKWIEFRHTPKDLDMANVVKEVQRKVWRLFGVKPVTQGDTEATPRATAEVQMDAQDSGLIRPILELLQAHVNARMIPLLVGDPELAGLVEFSFDLKRDASADETESEARADASDFDRGGLTINELREKRGRLPVVGGDVALIKNGGGYVTLDTLLGTDDSAPRFDPYPADASDDGTDGAGEVDDETGDAGSPDEDEQAPGEVEAGRWWGARAPARYDNINFTPPKGVQNECQRGLDWHEEGESGDGLQPETVRWARRLAAGEDITPEKARKMKAWLARHEVDKEGEGFSPGEDGYPSPGRVAWALWGGDPAVPWSNRLVEQMDRADEEASASKPRRAKVRRKAAPRVGTPIQARQLPGTLVRHRPGCSCGHHHSEPDGSIQRRASSLLPSDWQPEGKFKGYRTLNLDRLGSILIDYRRQVAPLYRRARIDIVAAFRSYVSDGDLSDSEAANLSRQVAAHLDRLHLQWEGATSEHYRNAARLGRDTATHFTGVQVVEDWREQGQMYQDRAMSYLVDTRGLITDLRTQLSTLIMAMVRSTRANALATRAGEDLFTDGTLDELAVYSAVSKVFQRNEHRIDNWSGRLVELANDTLIKGMNEGGTTDAPPPGDELPPEDPGPGGEWWVEWAAVGDKRMCATCEREGDAGFRPLSSLSIRPGGATECRARCRCVLVFWTREEVQNGTAVGLSNMDR